MCITGGHVVQGCRPPALLPNLWQGSQPVFGHAVAAPTSIQNQAQIQHLLKSCKISVKKVQSRKQEKCILRSHKTDVIFFLPKTYVAIGNHAADHLKPMQCTTDWLQSIVRRRCGAQSLRFYCFTIINHFSLTVKNAKQIRLICYPFFFVAICFDKFVLLHAF